MRGAILLTISFLCAISAAVAVLVLCLRTDAVPNRLGSFERRVDEPYGFWLFTIIWVFGAFAGTLAISIGFLGTVFAPD